MGFSDLCSYWLPCKLLAECFATEFLPAALCIAHCEKQNDALPEKLSNQRAACLLLLVSFVCWNIVSKGVTDTSNHNCSLLLIKTCQRCLQQSDVTLLPLNSVHSSNLY